MRIRALLRNLKSPSGMQRRLLERRFRTAGLREATISIGDSEVFLWRSRPGKPALLLLHGFGASALWQWHPQVWALSRRYSLLVPDLLFFGRSTSRGPRTLEAQVAMVEALLDRHEVARADIVSLSYGGFVAHRLATRRPERVRRLVLTNSPGAVMRRTDYEALLSRFEVASIDELLLPRAPKDVKRLLSIAMTRPPPVPYFALVDALERLFDNQVEEKRALLDDLIHYLDDPALIEERPPQRTLVLWGEKDAVFPPDLGRRLHAALPDAEWKLLARTAHAPNLERGRAYSRAVLEFLAR